MMYLIRSSISFYQVPHSSMYLIPSNQAGIGASKLNMLHQMNPSLLQVLYEDYLTLKNISDALQIRTDARSSGGIHQSEKHLNSSGGTNRIPGTVWFPTRVVKRVSFCTRYELNRHSVPIVACCSILKQNAPGGCCSVLALSPTNFLMSVCQI